MIDLHTHILPGVDDGAEDIRETVKIIGEAKKQGITKIVATPHYLEEGYQLSPSEIKSEIKRLKNEVVIKDFDVKILPGSEVFITPDLGKKVEQGTITTINNSRYILIEFPSGYIPEYVEEVFYDLKIMGYFPIIAHPERNEQIIDDFYHLFKLIKRGLIYAQLNAGSITGAFGVQIKKTAYKLIENNLIHFIASDTHSYSNRRMYFQKGLEKLEEIDSVYVNRFKENAEKVINDQELKVEPPGYQRKKTFFERIKSFISM